MRLWTASVLSLLVLGCQELPLIDANECGNRVTEAAVGEACDGQATCGTPGSQHQCRYLCTRDPFDPIPCPDGYGCGADGVCRRATGNFVHDRSFTTSVTTDLQLADIDEDGCAELITTNLDGVLVSGFSGSSDALCGETEQLVVAGRPSKAQQLPSPVILLAHYEPSDDDRKEPVRQGPTLALIGQGELSQGLFRYDSDGPVLAPVLFASDRLAYSDARAFSFHARGVDIGLILAGAAGMGPPDMAGDEGHVLVFEDPRRSARELGTIPTAPDGVAAIAFGDVDPGPAPDSERCDEMVMAIAGEAAVRVFSLCDEGDGLALDAITQVALSAGTIRSLNASLALVDQDGDGHLDIVSNADGAAAQVAYGTGNGAFHSTPDLPDGEVADERMSLLAVDVGDGNHIFVAADFDQQVPGIEYVSIECPPASAPFASPVCQSLGGGCEAVVADIDDDTFLDIVTSQPQSPDITLLFGVEGGLFYDATLETACPAKYLAVGDLDGDFVSDIAFFDQDGRGPEQTRTLLKVAYGNRFAAPTPPQGDGLLESASGLTAGRFLAGDSNDYLYATRQVGASATEMGAAEPGQSVAGVQAAAFIETHARLVAAPFYFGDDKDAFEAEISELQVVASAGGALLGSAGPAVAMLTVEAPQGQPVLGTASLRIVPSDPTGDNVEPGPPSDAGAFTCDNCLLATVDRDGDGVQELLMLGSEEALLFERDETSNKLTISETFAIPYAFVGATSTNPAKHVPRPVAADVDGDGHQDVLARDADGSVIALWNDGSGKFEASLLVEAASCSGSSCGLTPALINLDGDGARELLVVGQGVFSAFDVFASRELHAISIDTGGVPTPPSMVDFSSVATGDINGDGVDDIVVLPASSFYDVLLGVPVIP